MIKNVLIATLSGVLVGSLFFYHFSCTTRDFYSFETGYQLGLHEGRKMKTLVVPVYEVTLPQNLQDKEIYLERRQQAVPILTTKGPWDVTITNCIFTAVETKESRMRTEILK